MTGDDRAPVHDECPKRMRFGPCGGVTLARRCEVDARRCPFVADDELGWDLPENLAMPPNARTSRRLGSGEGLPAVIVDVRYPRGSRYPTGSAADPRAAAGSVRSWWTAMAASLQGCAALLGEHVDNPTLHDDAGPIDPTIAIEALAGAGIPTIATVTARDRTAASAARTVGAYRAAGAAGIHCVTGDHPAVLGLDRSAWFGTESIELVSTAASLGVPPTVAESPASPGDRVGRLVAKQRAGAAAVILNHCGDPMAAVAFADRCRDAGVHIPLIAPVPMVADVATARALEAFPGLVLPAGLAASVAGATDPFARGLAWARHLSAELASSGRFAAVNLSGGARSDDPTRRRDLTEAFSRVVRESWT